jgi:hypothetical protein
MKRGLSALSPSVSRSRLIALLMPFSNSTKVSAGQRRSWSSLAGDEFARPFEQGLEHLGTACRAA